MVQDPIQDSRGDNGIPEDFVPLREASVGRQDQRPLFVPPRDKLKKQMRAVAIDRDVADLVDNQEFWLAVKLQPLLDPVFGISLGQRSDQGHGLGEVSPVAFRDGFHAQGHGQMGLAYAGRAEEDDVFAVRDEPTLGQLLDSLLVDRRLKGEVERLQGLDVGELGHRGSDGDVLFLLGGDFLGQDLVHEVGVGDVVLGGFFESRLETIVDCGRAGGGEGCPGYGRGSQETSFQESLIDGQVPDLDVVLGRLGRLGRLD